MHSLLTYLNSLATLSAESERLLLKIAKPVYIKKNDNLQHIGHTCRTIYFLKSGVARIYYFKDTTDITESFAFENNLVVRYESLFAALPSKKGIQVLEDSELFAIPSGELFMLFDHAPELERLFRKIVESALVEQINRIESLQFHTAEERYKSLLKEAPDVIKRVPLKFIASYLGITPVSLSRIRARM